MAWAASFVLAALLTLLGMALAMWSVHGPDAVGLLAAACLPLYAVGGFVLERFNILENAPTELVIVLMVVTQWLYAYWLLRMVPRLWRRLRT